MIENFVKNTAELNLLAQNLRDNGEIERLNHLADQWLIPEEDVQAFIKGTRIRLAEIPLDEKVFTNASEKLTAEQYQFSDDRVIHAIGRYLMQHLNENGLEEQVLQEHKSLEKCMNYILTRAYEESEDLIKKEQESDRKRPKDQRRRGVGRILEEEKVYRWAVEYYLLDDKKEDRKKKKKWEKEERERRERKKTAATVQTVKSSTVPKVTKPEDGQLSLFDLGKQADDNTVSEKADSGNGEKEDACV